MITKINTHKADNLSLEDWLLGKLSDDHSYLLAFADDGLFWGKKDKQKLMLSHEIDPKISPALKEKTLQQAFIFGKDNEVRLFKSETSEWVALKITDKDEVVIPESQILWGDQVKKSEQGFYHLRDAKQQGLDYIVPLKEIAGADLTPDEEGQGGKQCIRLDIHHLVKYDEETGEARIALSRLAGLRVGTKNEEVEK